MPTIGNCLCAGTLLRVSADSPTLKVEKSIILYLAKGLVSFMSQANSYLWSLTSHFKPMLQMSSPCTTKPVYSLLIGDWGHWPVLQTTLCCCQETCSCNMKGCRVKSEGHQSVSPSSLSLSPPVCLPSALPFVSAHCWLRIWGVFVAEVGLLDVHSAALHSRNSLHWGFSDVDVFYSALGGPRLMGQLSALCSPAHKAFDSPL